MSGDQKKIEFPYNRVYFIGDSLMSTDKTAIEINTTSAWVWSSTIKVTIPNPSAYYNRRFSNGDGFVDYFTRQIPELNKTEWLGINETFCFNYAYPGAGSQSNYLTFVSQELLNKGLSENSWSWTVTSSSVKQHPGIDRQFDRVMSLEIKVQSSLDTKRPLVFIWGAGAHNDLMSLTYLAGYPNGWTTMPALTMEDIKTLETSLNNVASKSAKNLQTHIRWLYEIGVSDFVVVDALPIHITPYFTDVKKQYKDVKGFATFIDSMSGVYNQHLKEGIDMLRQNYTEQHEAINLTYISCQDLSLPNSLESISFINALGQRDGKDFVLSKATAVEKEILKEAYFYDHIHLTSRGYEFVSKFITDQLKQKNPDLQAYYAQKPAVNEPKKMAAPANDQYLFIMKGPAPLGIGTK